MRTLPAQMTAVGMTAPGAAEVLILEHFFAQLLSQIFSANGQLRKFGCGL